MRSPVDLSSMRVPAGSVAERAATLDRLRASLSAVEAPAKDAALAGGSGLAVPAQLRGVHPGFRAGAAHAIESRALALLSFASALPDGAWGAIVGMPDLGVEAAGDLGVQLERVVLVPHPGAAWFDVVGHLVAAMPLVLAVAPQRVTPGDAARITARLRGRASVLLVHGAWQGAASRMRATDTRWKGLGRGIGRLGSGALSVEVSTGGPVRRAVVDLPAAVRGRDAIA